MRAVGRKWISEPVSECQKPTTTKPGSPERMMVYQQRVDNGEEMFHPEDRYLLPNGQMVVLEEDE